MLSSDVSCKVLTAIIPPSIATEEPNLSPYLSLAVSASEQLGGLDPLDPATESLRRFNTHHGAPIVTRRSSTHNDRAAVDVD